MAGVVSTMTPMKDVMLERLREGFSTTTDLADTLVRLHGVSFRQAHDVVVDVILKALAEGKKAEEISTDMVAGSSEKVVGRRLEVSEEEIRSAVDPVQNLARRSSVGGPAPGSVEKMIRGRLATIAAQEVRHRERVDKLRRAYDALAMAEKSLI
jgi:argininosuccinate lyase